MRVLALALIFACGGGDSEDSESIIPEGCDTTDPGGMTCSVAGQCRVECYCEGSIIEASGCEGECPSAETLCETYCQAVGWTGVACYEPE